MAVDSSISAWDDVYGEFRATFACAFSVCVINLVAASAEVVILSQRLVEVVELASVGEVGSESGVSDELKADVPAEFDTGVVVSFIWNMSVDSGGVESDVESEVASSSIDEALDCAEFVEVDVVLGGEDLISLDSVG